MKEFMSEEDKLPEALETSSDSFDGLSKTEVRPEKPTTVTVSPLQDGSATYVVPVTNAVMQSLDEPESAPTDEEGALVGEQLRLDIHPERLITSYLAKLVELELKSPGNPHLKATIQKRLEAWEKDLRLEQLVAVSSRMQITVAEVEELLQQRIEEVMNQSQFFCATRTSVFVNHILNGDRRFKSLFEVGNQGSTVSSSERSSAERELFGFPQFDTSEGERAKSSRPTYGYFALNENGIFNEQDKHPPSNELWMYGRVTVKIKKKVAIERGTMSLYDSFGIGDLSVFPIALPHYSSLFHYWAPGFSNTRIIQNFLDKPLSNRSLWEVSGWYTEVQFHGGLSVDDIESVHLSLGNGLDQEEIDVIVAAVEAYNLETGGNIVVVLY